MKSVNFKMYNHFTLSVIILLSAACKDKTAGSTGSQSAGSSMSIEMNNVQMKNAGVKTDTLKSELLNGIIKVNGMIDVPPQNMVSVSLPVGGYLSSTKLLPGMHLRKGEVIAVMEDQQYIQIQQDYLTALVNFTGIEKEYFRQKELNITKAGSDKSLEQAESAYKSQKILLRSLSEKLRLIGINPSTLNENNISRSINIYSPINGFVSKVNVNIGRYINPSDIMFELVNPEDIHLNLTVFEKDLGKISIGSKVMAYTNQEPDKFYLCDVILIGKDVSREGFVQVHCHFDTYSPILIPGMYMNADVYTGDKLSFSISESAIISFEGKNYVFTEISKGKFSMKEVQTGLNEQGRCEILNHEDFDSDRIVVSGAYEMLMMINNKEEE